MVSLAKISKLCKLITAIFRFNNEITFTIPALKIVLKPTLQLRNHHKRWIQAVPKLTANSMFKKMLSFWNTDYQKFTKTWYKSIWHVTVCDLKSRAPFFIEIIFLRCAIKSVRKPQLRSHLVVYKNKNYVIYQYMPQCRQILKYGFLQKIILNMVSAQNYIKKFVANLTLPN